MIICCKGPGTARSDVAINILTSAAPQAFEKVRGWRSFMQRSILPILRLWTLSVSVMRAASSKTMSLSFRCLTRRGSPSTTSVSTTTQTRITLPATAHTIYVFP